MSGATIHNKQLHVAPMVDVSYYEFRFLLRLLTRHTILWTEMIADETLIHSNHPERYIFNRDSRTVLQIGGCRAEWVPRVLTQAGTFQEVNLNCECPSTRVAHKQNKNRRIFGAALLKQPSVASAMVREMGQFAGDNKKPISVKMRIGVDDDWEDNNGLESFIDQCLEAGCHRFVLHARKVIMDPSWKPIDNRTIPPLDYPTVYRMCHAYPSCEFILNGGIRDLNNARRLVGLMEDSDTDQSDQHNNLPCQVCQQANGSCLRSIRPVPSNLVGIMMGKAVQDNPALMGRADTDFFAATSNPHPHRQAVLEAYIDHLETRLYPPRCLEDDDNNGSRKPTCFFSPPLEEAVLVPKCPRCENPYVEVDNLQEPSHLLYGTALVDRALKPVRNLFHGLPKSRAYKAELERLARTKALRNCGPGHLIRRAMLVLPQDVRQKEF